MYYLPNLYIYIYIVVNEFGDPSSIPGHTACISHV